MDMSRTVSAWKGSCVVSSGPSGPVYMWRNLSWARCRHVHVVSLTLNNNVQFILNTWIQQVLKVGILEDHNAWLVFTDLHANELPSVVDGNHAAIVKLTAMVNFYIPGDSPKAEADRRSIRQECR